ncbi:hypothetical protein M9Y10_017450 [Tritrichomonas musculus]|uniref:Viral A-type inclusion protein n=1 Tax=Tritrichomonas musculus TaxID=1915356 RepID=A0ABR2HV88_9EUKA
MEKRAISSSIDDFFKSRQKSFLDSLERILDSISSDELIKQMFHNKNAANYLPSRITEIISNILHEDRENYIQRLTERLQSYENFDNSTYNRSTFARQDRKKLNRDLKTIKTINNSIHSTVNNFSNDIRIILNKARNSVSRTIDSLVHDNGQLKNRLDYLNKQTKNLSRDNEDLRRQLSISQDNLLRSQKQHRELTEILESKENDLANMKNLNYSLSSTISKTAPYSNDNNSFSPPSPFQKKKSKSNSFLMNNDFNDGFNNNNDNDLLTEYKQKLDAAYQQIANLKSQLQINDQGELMQSFVYASETIKSKDQQIQDLQNHIKKLKNEIQSLGNQIQALTAQGASPTKRVTFQDLNKNDDRYCSYEEFEHIMHERNDLADQLEALQSESFKSDKQKKQLESKINDLLQQKSTSERQYQIQIQELQEKNEQLSMSLKDSSSIGNLLNKERSENEKKELTIRQKDSLIQSLTQENAKLIGQFTVLSKIDEQSKSKQDFSVEVLLDSANFDSQQRSIIMKIFNESQKRNDQKLAKYEQALKNKIKSENALKQDIEKASQTVDNHQKLIEEKQKQIEDLNVSSSQLKDIRNQNESKIFELNSKIASLEATIRELQSNVANKQKQIDDFRPIFESFKQQKESLEEKINQIQRDNSIEIQRLQGINSDISEQSIIKEREAEKAQRTNKQLSEEIEKVHTQNEQLLLINQQSQETINLNKNLIQKLESYKKAHQESKKQLTILAASNQQLQNKLKAKRSQVSQQVELIDKLQKTIDSVSNEKNALITDLQTKTKQLEEENIILKSNLNMSLNNMNRQSEFNNSGFMNNNNSRLMGNSQSLMNNNNNNSSMERDDSALRSLQKQLEMSQVSKDAAEKQLSALQTENESLLNTIKQSENENEKLNQSIAELNSSLSKSQLENQKQIDENNKLQNENRKLQYEKEQHQEENNKLQSTNNKLQMSYERQQEENSKLQSSNKQLQKLNSRQQEENSKLQSSNKQLQKLNSRQQEENSKLQSSNKQLQKLNSKQQEEINKLHDDIDKNKRTYERQTDENSRLKRANEQQIEENNKLRMTNEKQNDENNKLQYENQKQKDENNKIQFELTKLQKINEKQNDEISKLQNDFEKQKDENYKLHNEINKLQRINEKQIDENNKLLKTNENQHKENEQLSNVNEKQSEEINELHKANDLLQRELQVKSKQSENQASMIVELQSQNQSLNNTIQKVLKKSARIVPVNEVTQVPSKLEELNNVIVRIKELLNLKKSDDVVSSIVNLLKQIQNACQNLNIRDTNDFPNATLILAKEIEENRKFKNEFSKREQKISSVLHSTYSFEAIPEILVRYQKLEQEINNILRSSNSSSIIPGIQSLVQFESTIEKTLGSSTKEEAMKEIAQLKSNEKIIEKILGVEDMNKIPRTIEDLYNDVQQLKKCLVIEDFHTAVPVFNQVYLSLKKALKNSESFERIFSLISEIVTASKQVNKMLQTENLEESVQVIQTMKDTISKTESEIDHKLIEGESLPEKVSQLTNRNKILHQAISILNVDDHNSVVGAIQLLLEQFNQVKAIVINGKSLPIPTSPIFSKSSKSSKFSRVSSNADNQEIIQEVVSMKNEVLNLAQMLDVSEDSIVPKVAELLDHLKQISSTFTDSLSSSRSNSSSFYEEIINLINKQNQQILKISEILSTDPERIVESVNKMNHQVRKISEIISPNEDHLHNESLVEVIQKQNQQLKKISETISPKEDYLHNDNLVDIILKQNQQLKKISETISPNEDYLKSDTFVDSVIKQNLLLKRISDIISPNEDFFKNDALFNIILKQNQQLKKISDTISPDEDYLKNDSFVEAVIKQNQQLKKITEIISSNEEFSRNEGLVDLVLKQNQQLKKISEVYNDSEDFIDEIIQQNQQIKSISEIYSPSDDIVNDVLQDHQQILKINEIYPDSSNIVDDIASNNLILQKIAAKLAKGNEHNRSPKKKNDFNDLVTEVSSIKKQIKQISKIIQTPADSIVNKIDELHSENLKNNEVIQKAFQIINTEAPEEIYEALESYSNIIKILKIDQNVPQKVNEMKSIIEETTSILPQISNDKKASKKKNIENNVDLVSQAKSTVNHLNFLSDVIHNITELVNNNNSDNDSYSEDDMKSPDSLYSKIENLKKNSESMNGVLLSIQEKLSNNDLSSIEDEIDLIQEDLNVKNMLLNSVASSISSNWEQIKPNDLKEIHQSNQSSSNSPIKRKLSQSKTVNDVKINQFEKIYEKFVELKKQFDLTIKQNQTESMNKESPTRNKSQKKDLLTSITNAIQIIQDKSNLIQQLTQIVKNSNKSNDEIEEEEEDVEEDDKKPSYLIQKVSSMVETINGISGVLNTRGNETELTKNVQELVDRLNMNEATVSLQSFEFQTLSSKVDMNEGLIGKLCQLTNTNDTNSLTRRVFELEKEHKTLSKLFDSEDVTSQTKSIWLILTSISHIIDVEKSKLPEEIQKVVNENQRLTECTNQIDSVLFTEYNNYNNRSQSQIPSQSFALNDRLRMMPMKVQQLLNERDSLRNNVEQIKEAINEPEEFIEKVQNLFQREVKIEQILNVANTSSSSELNEIIPEMIAKLSDFHENVLQLIKPQNKENAIDDISALINDNEERKKIMDSIAQIISHDNERTEDLADLDNENEEQNIDLVNEIQNLHEANIQMKRYIDELSLVAEVNPKKKIKKVKLNNSNDNLNQNMTMTIKPKQQQRQQSSNFFSFSPIRPKQAQTMTPIIKQQTSQQKRNSNKDLMQVVRELKDKEREIIEIVGKKYENNYISQISQMKNALNSIHQLIFDSVFEEEEEENEETNINMNSFQTIEPIEEEEDNNKYDSYIKKISENISELTKMKAELEYIQKTTNNDSNYIQKVGNVFDQMRQIRKTLNADKESAIPQLVSDLVKTKDSIDQILTTSKQMVSTEAIERSQSSLNNTKNISKTVNASTQTMEISDSKLFESDLPSRVQEVVDMNIEFQEQISEICSILPESENVIAEVRQMKENEDKLKKIFKSENLVQSATELTEIKQSIESILNDTDYGKDNQNNLVSFISQLVSENEQRKHIIQQVQKETDEENDYIDKIKQLKQDESKLQEILKSRTELPTIAAKYVNTVDSISQIIFERNESESDSENENDNQFEKVPQIDHSNLINEVQTIFDSFNKMKKELNDLNSIMDLNQQGNSVSTNKELIKATKEMKKRESELKSILKTDDLISQANRLTQTIKDIQKSVKNYESQATKEIENKGVITNPESDDDDDEEDEINYDELPNQIEDNLSMLLNSRLAILRVQKVTNETENYEEKINNVMSLHKKIDSILNSSEYLPFSPVTLKNMPSAIEYLVETQNEVCEILSSIEFKEKDDQSNENKTVPKTSKSTATTDIKKKEQKVLQIPSKVQILAEKAKILDSINEDYLNKDDDSSIPDQVSLLTNNTKVLISMGNTLKLKKPQQILEKVVNQFELINQLKQMLGSENVVKTVDSIQKENLQLKETNSKINEILFAFNQSSSNTGQLNSPPDTLNEEGMIEEIQTMINTISELSNERQTIVRIVNNENPIEEIESLQNLRENLQQLLPRKGIIPEVQKLLQTSQIASKSAKMLGCQNSEFIPEKIGEMKENLKRLEEETENLNDVLKSNSMSNSITIVKNLTSLLHDPEDLNEEVSNLIESLKKCQQELSNRETQERATINELQTSLMQVMRLTDQKTASDAIGQVEENEETIKKLQKVLQVSEPSQISPRIDSLLSERAKIIMNIDTNYINRDPTAKPSPTAAANANATNEFDFGLENSSEETNSVSSFIYLENDELPQCIYNMKRGIRENENILKRVAEIIKHDSNESNKKNNGNNGQNTKLIDFNQIPRVVAEICQSSQLIKSIHTIMTDQDISDQMPETIQKLIQDSAELTVLTKENDELKRNYEDVCNFVKRLLSIIMEGHLPQKMKFPIPLKAKDKLLEFLRSFKKRSDRNAADVKVILKRASTNGYRDNDLIEAVNCIVDESIAFEKQQNNEDMHEKTKSLKQIIERQNSQYHQMMSENKQAIQDLKDKIELLQRQASEKDAKNFQESQVKAEKLAEANADLDKEKRIHEELIRFISKQSIDTDFLSVNLPVNEMRVIFQYSK